MADRSGLTLIGLLFATVTFTVMSITALVVAVHADENYTMESYAVPTLAVDVKRRTAQ
jgi:hypothetical protein